MAQHFDTRISLGKMIVVAVEENYKRLFHIYMNILFFKFFFHLGCCINIEQSSSCYTAGPRWIFILNIEACTCQSQAS